jgi:hypothetical protein
MRYRPSQSRYAGGGKVKFLVYASSQPVRGGGRRERRRMKRLYFAANATDITLGRVGTQERRTGTRVFGVTVRYQSRLPRTLARRGRTTYELPSRRGARRTCG